VKPKTDVEARVYEVLSHKNWGAASSIMNQIARDTWDYEKFAIITRIMWENVEIQRPAAWRVVFKGLTLCEHLVKNGSERCVDDARNHGHVLRKLQQFNYYEGTIDRGLGVREKSKQLVEMLNDNERIREERQKAKKLREKFQGRSAAASGGGGEGYSGGDGWNTSGGGGGGGGWDSSGKDDWNSGGGYASGGIDSGKDNVSNGARGRYDDDHSAPTAAAPAGPTFAQAPATKTGKKVKKKKAPLPPSSATAAAPGKFAWRIVEHQAIRNVSVCKFIGIEEPSGVISNSFI
jgi:epsin